MIGEPSAVHDGQLRIFEQIVEYDRQTLEGHVEVLVLERLLLSLAVFGVLVPVDHEVIPFVGRRLAPNSCSFSVFNYSAPCIKQGIVAANNLARHTY